MTQWIILWIKYAFPIHRISFPFDEKVKIKACSGVVVYEAIQADRPKQRMSTGI